jgi:ubiquinone/menaquinone biosynthesis C-methylase UbiE
MKNIDRETVASFGDEWSRFRQTEDQISLEELQDLYDRYFAWSGLDMAGKIGADIGCGSGRWAAFSRIKAEKLHLVDASATALSVARKRLQAYGNLAFHHASADEIPVPDGHLDFAYSLGVLHHIPNTEEATRACVRKLKFGAPFLIYVYYDLSNKPFWFKAIWRLTNAARLVISRLPNRLKDLVCDILAVVIYWPMSNLAKAFKSGNMPLRYYSNSTLHTLRTDARDRFGTRLEKRYSRDQVISLMEGAGLGDIRVKDSEPYWTAIGYRVT